MTGRPVDTLARERYEIRNTEVDWVGRPGEPIVCLAGDRLTEDGDCVGGGHQATLKQ